MAVIDRELLRDLRDDLNEAIKAVGAKHGVVLTMGNASFAGNNATMKMDIAGIVGGEVITKQVRDFQSYERIHGLSKDDLGRTFMYGGTSYKVTGFNPRKRLGLLAERQDGKVFCFPADAIKKLARRHNRQPRLAQEATTGTQERKRCNSKSKSK